MATAGAPPFLAKAMRRFPSKNPPDRLPVFQKSRSRNEFRREHAGVRSFTPAAARASTATENTQACGSSAPAAARASAAAAGTRACGSSTPDWIYLLTITAKEQGH